MTKKIFAPGTAVSTTWLNGSQYLGPANPGVVFVANPVNDWEYPLLKGASVDLGDFAQYFVTRSGVQSIDDVKTFTSIPNIPTSTQPTGLQAVNIDRLNTTVNAVDVSLSADITALSNAFAAQNLINTAAINAITTNLNSNFVTLATDQTISGTKTFNSIQVPNPPVAAADLVNLSYFVDNVVNIAGAQSITGTKYFTDIQVPNPNSANDAVNLAYLNSVIGTIPQISVGCIRVGNIQIVFGQRTLSGVWFASGVIGAIQSYSSVAPAALPFVSISGMGTSSDRLILIRATPSLTEIDFVGELPTGVAQAQPDDCTIRWVVFGYTS